MNSNDRGPTSQGASGRRNAGRGTGGDAGGSGGAGGSGNQGSGNQGSGNRGSGNRGSGNRGSGGQGFGGGGFGGRGFGGGGWSSGWRSTGARGGMPNIFLLMAVFVFFFGAFASCQSQPSGPGQVAGQIKALAPDRTMATLAGAQVVLRGASNTYTTVSTDVPEGAEGTDAYNYRFDNVPPGRYTMAVTPPAGAGLQPEADITLEVDPGELFPQSVMLLAEGVQKPRPLSPSELQPGQTGYLNERGERVVYNQGDNFGLDDALLLYLLFRNPPAYGYGAPPIVYSSPRSGSSYRVDPPPRQTSSGSRVTTRQPSVPGQGSTRPSSAPASGSGPTYRPSGSDSGGATVPSTGAGSSSSGSSSSGSRSSSSGSSSSSAPSQGASRPSSSSSSSSRPSSSAGSRSGGGSSSSGGRR